MFNWLVNRVITRVSPGIREAVREELEARDDSLRAEHRKMLHEVEDTLDKLTRRAAREGMRKVREARAAIDEQPAADLTAVQEAQLQHAAGAGPQSKAQLRRQFAHMLRRPS